MTTGRRRTLPNRGDSGGRDVIAFALALLAVLVGAGILLLSLPRRDDIAAPGASRSPSPSVTASGSASVRPGASRSPDPSPSRSPAQSGPSVEPSESLDPSASPSSGGPAETVGIGEEAPVLVNGRAAVRVQVLRTIRAPIVDGQAASSGNEWFGAEIQIVASRRFLGYLYDEKDWVAVDDSGAVIELGDIALDMPLGRGQVFGGTSKRGFVAFEVPRRASIERLRLLGDDGSILVEVDVTE